MHKIRYYWFEELFILESRLFKLIKIISKRLKSKLVCGKVGIHRKWNVSVEYGIDHHCITVIKIYNSTTDPNKCATVIDYINLFIKKSKIYIITNNYWKSLAKFKILGNTISRGFSLFVSFAVKLCISQFYRYCKPEYIKLISKDVLQRRTSGKGVNKELQLQSAEK